eukprot:UN03302
MARNSSFHSHVNVDPKLSSSLTFYSNNSHVNNTSSQGNKSQKVSVDIIEQDKVVNDAQFMAALSPSINNSIEDMYGSPKSPDGVPWTGGRVPVFGGKSSRLQNEVTLKKPLSPIQNQANLEQQIEMNVLPVTVNGQDECEDNKDKSIVI